jgi:acetyltransferase
MSIRNLSYLLQPASVTLIGASQKPGSPGNLIAQNLRSGGFDGEITAVNPKYTQVADLPCFARVAELPQTAELAVIVTPPRSVPELIRQLAEHGTRAAVVISAGINGKLQQAMLEAAQPANLRILGPDSLGIMHPAIGLNAGYAHLSAAAGHIALLAQSGTVLTALIDWAADRDIGFSHRLAMGAMAHVDFGDLLNYLAEDSNTHAILLYLETITHSRKFMSAARAAARVKPVIVLKSGRFTGDDQVYDAA